MRKCYIMCNYLKKTVMQSSYFRMRVINHNWLATKQHLHPQSVMQ